MYEIRWVDSATQIPSRLWEECFPIPYEGLWWYQALEQCGIAEQFTFLYAIVLSDGQPVAIAPAFLMDVPISLVAPSALAPLFHTLGQAFPTFSYQRTLFIGSPCADEGRVGMVNDTGRLQVLRCVHRGLLAMAQQYNATMCVWKDFPDNYSQQFVELARTEKLFRLISYPGTLVQLPGSKKEDYLASLKASRRSKLKKKLKLAADIPVNVEVMQQPDTETMDEMFALFWQTYEKGSTKFERLNRNFFELISAAPQAWYIVLRSRDSGRPVAFALCFALGKQVINKFIGIDYRQPKEWFLYFRLWEAAVDWCYTIGADSMQSGQTGYSAKVELGHEMVPLTNYCSHRNAFIHWIFAIGSKAVNWDTLDKDLAEFVKAYPELLPK
jgi:hypothetical protein